MKKRLPYLIVILLAGAALLLSTGSPPEGEISGVYGLVYSIEAFLAEIIAGAAEWVDYVVDQIARLSELLRSSNSVPPSFRRGSSPSIRATAVRVIKTRMRNSKDNGGKLFRPEPVVLVMGPDRSGLTGVCIRLLSIRIPVSAFQHTSSC